MLGWLKIVFPNSATLCYFNLRLFFVIQDDVDNANTDAESVTSVFESVKTFYYILLNFTLFNTIRY